MLGTEKVPQRNWVTKIAPNVRVNFLVRFASKPLFYWVMADNPLEMFRKFFGAVRAIFWFCGSFLAPDYEKKQTPDLHPPHGLAPSETMVSIPLWAQKTLEIKGFLGLERPFLDWSCKPRAQGVGVDPCLLKNVFWNKHKRWHREVIFILFEVILASRCYFQKKIASKDSQSRNCQK